MATRLRSLLDASGRAELGLRADRLFRLHGQADQVRFTLVNAHGASLRDASGRERGVTFQRCPPLEHVVPGDMVRLIRHGAGIAVQVLPAGETVARPTDEGPAADQETIALMARLDELAYPDEA